MFASGSSKSDGIDIKDINVTFDHNIVYNDVGSYMLYCNDAVVKEELRSDVYRDKNI